MCAELSIAQRVDTHQSIGITTGIFTADDYLRSGLITANGNLELTSERAQLATNGVLSRFESGRIAGYLDAAGHLKLGNIRRIQIALESDAGTGVYRGSSSGHYSRFSTRLGSQRLWMVLGVGQARDKTSYTTNRIAGGGYLLRSPFRITANSSVIRSQGETYGNISTVGIGNIGSSEFSLALGATNPPSTKHFTASSFKPWVATSATIPINSAIAFTVSAGKLQPDIERAFQGVTFLTAGIKLTANQPSTTGKSDIAIKNPALVVGKMDSGGYTSLTIYAGAQKSVEIMSDFSEWSPIKMIAIAGGKWTARIQASSGAHSFVIRTDGGAWHVPAGFPAISDGYGSSSGILIIDAATNSTR